MRFHCAFRTEFLTAKAQNTFLSVNNRKTALHRDGVCRTNLRAFSATDTFFLGHHRFCSKSKRKKSTFDLSEHRIILGKQRTVAIDDPIKVASGILLPIPVNRYLLKPIRKQPASLRCLQCRNIFRIRSDHLCRDPVQRMRILRCKQSIHRIRSSLRRPVSFHSNHRIAYVQDRFPIFTDIDDHIGKVVRVRITIMILRFQNSRNRSEQVLNRIRQGHHPMRFQFADIDHTIA